MNTNHSLDASLRRRRSLGQDNVDPLLPEPKRIKIEDEHSGDETSWEKDGYELLGNSGTFKSKSEGLDNFPSKSEHADVIDDFLLSDGGVAPSPMGPVDTVKSEYLADSLKTETRDVTDDILVFDVVSPRAQVLDILSVCSLTSICPGLLITLEDAVAKVGDETIAEAKLARKLKDIGDFCVKYSQQASVISSLANFRELVTWLISISVELGLSEDRLVDQAIIQDELDMIGSFISVMANERAHGEVCTLRDHMANRFLNALQEFLDMTGPFRHLSSPRNSHLCLNYKTLHLTARQMLCKLSSESNTIPSSLFLKRIHPHSTQHPLGSGAFADVFQAEYDGQLVVLKRLRTFLNSAQRDEDHKSLCRESLPWRQLKHRHIVPFLGIDPDSFAPCYCMVSPLIRNGNMLDYVNDRRHDEHGYEGIDLAGLFIDVADGLSYLHGQAVIHGDLRAENVLVDESRRACISDFGLISFIETVDHSTSIRGNPRFMAPELLDGTQDKRTTASDIYSFASLCVQTMTGQRPYNDVKVDVAVLLKVIQGERPTRPEPRLFPPSIPTEDFWKLVRTCWSWSPDSRPSAQDLVNRLQSSRHNVLGSVHKPANLEHMPNSSTDPSAAEVEGGSSLNEATHAGNSEGGTVTCLWDDCGLVYNDLLRLAKHIDYSTDSASRLFSHLNVFTDHIGKRKPNYTCQWGTCHRRGLTQASRTALITHVQIHTGQKPFICALPECRKTFTHKNELTKHMRVHRSLSPSAGDIDLYEEWNPEVKVITAALVHTLIHESEVQCVRFSADGKYLATVCDRTAQIYDVKTGAKTCVLVDENTAKTSGPYIESVCFSPDGKYLATAENKQIKIWDIAKKRILHILDGHTQEIYSLEFSRNGRLIVSGSGDQTVRIWDMDTVSARAAGLSKVLASNEPYVVDAGVTSVTISPDERLVAAGSLDNVVRIWDIGTGTLLERLRGHTDSVYSVAFTPDGKGLVSGSLDETLKHWDIRAVGRTPPGGPMKNEGKEGKGASKCTMNFLGDGGTMRSVAVSADGQWVVSGSGDGVVQFWDFRSARVQLALRGNQSGVRGVHTVDLSAQGGMFASGGGDYHDYHARIWSYTAL